VLYHIDELFTGDMTISLQEGPERSHYIGRSTDKELLEKQTSSGV